MSNLHVSEHPLVKHKLTLLRDKKTDHVKFRQLVRELSLLLCYEATRDLRLTDTSVETPMGIARGSHVTHEIGLVPILRAGLGMVEGLWELIPSAEVWHIGLYRDEKTLQPVQYYNKLPPEVRVHLCLILDPMLATGGSAVAAADILKKWGAPLIKYVGLIGAPEGVKALSEAHPEIDIHLAAVDERLNEIGYIVPGLGDAGDRQFGTT
ncbi:MAG: uracil phosphoribosyltransferase [Anaerolineae bacterium]|nr:uracil phosphoribosyltransferase [Anaerolineae bacterium]